jgi:superfamily II DNA or RNA helicase
MSDAQTIAVKQLKDEYGTIIAGRALTAANGGVVLSKVLQVLLGSVIASSNTNDVVDIDATARYDVIKEMVEASNSKTIIFAPYRAAVRRITNYFADYGAEFIDGSVSEKNRADILKRFDTVDSFRVLVAHPGTMAHGITATAASTIIWAGAPMSTEIFQQANNRIDRPGQVHKMTIAYLISHPVEQAVYNVLRKRVAAQDDLLATLASL